MSLLAPLYILGGLAIGLPILFHLTRRIPKERVAFSSLMFLSPSPPRMSRKSQLSDLFLLLLRCAAICLLAAAFARPFFSEDRTLDAGSSPRRKTIVLLDTSASMRREDIWSRAVKETRQVLADAGPVDSLAVLAFDRSVRPVVSLEEWTSAAPDSRHVFASRLDELKPTWGDTSLANALIHAAELASRRESDGDDQLNRQIVLISDLQRGSRLEELESYTWPDGVSLAIRAIAPTQSTNAAIGLLAETSDAALKVRVTNSADAEREQFELAWRVGSEFVGERKVVYVPPGESRVVSAPAYDSAELARLILSGDDHDFDNTVFLAPTVSRIVRVGYIGGDAPDDPTAMRYFLDRAFPDNPARTVEIVSEPDLGKWFGSGSDGDDLGFLLIADEVANANWPVVEQHLKRGGTVFFVLPNAESAEQVFRLMNAAKVEAAEADVADYAMLGWIDFQHPLFAHFADPKFSDFTKIHIWKYRALRGLENADIKVVARFDTGDPALIEYSASGGTVFALTTSWSARDSQLARSSKFVPLLNSLLDQSAGVGAQRARFVVGDGVEIPKRLRRSAPVSISKPDGAQVQLDETGLFQATDQPGPYTLSGAPGMRFAVNLSPAESQTAPMSPDDLARVGVALLNTESASKPLSEESKRQLLATELENRQKMWRWLLVAALGVLVLETWLAGVRPKAESGPGESSSG